MHEKIRRWAYTGMVASISILMLIAVLLFAWKMEEATPWREMKAADWGVWVGGLGTVATLAGTIWLATASDRRRRQEQLDLALVTAAELTLWIIDLNQTIEAARNQLPLKLNANDDTRLAFAEVLVTIESAGMCHREHIAQLVILPNHTAARLAWVMTKLRSTLGKIRQISLADTLNENATPRVTEVMDRQFQNISADLEKLENECVTFLKLHGFGGKHLSNVGITPATGADAPW